MKEAQTWKTWQRAAERRQQWPTNGRSVVRGKPPPAPPGAARRGQGSGRAFGHRGSWHIRDYGSCTIQVTDRGWFPSLRLDVTKYIFVDRNQSNMAISHGTT